MTRDEIVRAVKGRLDEFSPFEEPGSLVALPTSDVKPMDSIIESVLAKAQDSVLMVVPLYLVRETVVDITQEGDGVQTVSGMSVMGRMNGDVEVGVMDLPQDFLRLHTVRYDNWRRVVDRTYNESDEMYKVQRNRHTRGRTEKPVVCVADGRMEVYSLTFAEGERGHCERFTYIPRTQESAVVFEDTIAPLVILEAARMCLEIFGDLNGVKALAQEEQTWLRNKI